MSGILRMDARRQLLLLLVLAFVLRVGNALLISGSPVFLAPTSDEAEHYQLALKLMNNDWLGQSAGPFHRPQLFAYLIAAVMSVLGSDFMVVHLVVLAFDLVSIPLWYGAARCAFSRPAAFLGTLAIVLYRPLVHFAGTGYMESFAIFLIALLFWLLSRAWIAQRRGASPWGWCAAIGLTAGLCVMTRPTIMLLLPFVGGFAVLPQVAQAWQPRRWSRAIAAGLVFSAMSLLPVALNFTRHALLFNITAPLGTASELAFHMANNRDGWGWEVSSPGMEFEVYQNLPMIEGGVNPTIPEVRKWWGDRNSAYLREEPGRWAVEFGLKLLQVVNRWEIHCTQNYLLFDELSIIHRLLPGLGVFGPIGLLGVVLALSGGISNGFRSLGARHSLRLMMVVWIAIYLVGVAIYLSIARHRLPALPPLLLLSGWALWELSTWLRTARFRRVLFGIAVIAVGFVATRLPVIPDWMVPHERWWTQVNLGVAEITLNRPTEAIIPLRIAVEMQPEKLEGWRQLALAYSLAGEHANAIAAQQRLLTLFRLQYPKYYMVEAKVLESLARYQKSAGLQADAIATAEQVVALTEQHPKALRLLEEIREPAE